MLDTVSSSYDHVVRGRHLLAVDGVSTSTAKPTGRAVWEVSLVVGNHVVFALCIVVLVLYVAAVVTRIVLHAYWGPVRIMLIIRYSGL